jgi:hypothetical protein
MQLSSVRLRSSNSRGWTPLFLSLHPNKDETKERNTDLIFTSFLQLSCWCKTGEKPPPSSDAHAPPHTVAAASSLRFLPQVDSRSRQLISSHHTPPRHGSVAMAEFSNQGFILSRSSLLSNLLSRRYADLFFLIFFHAGMAC